MTDTQFDVNYGSVKHKEAIKLFLRKLLIPTNRWDDMLGGIHAKAFMVAGAVKLALLQDLYKAVLGAIEDGDTVTQFRKNFDDIVRRHGWSYNGKRGWRTSLIYNTNKRAARMAGRWEQAWRTKETRPYMQYMDAGDGRVRPQHHLWNNMTLPIEHPWWNTHYPPNGWGPCRCTVRTLSKRQMEEEGLRVSDEPNVSYSVEMDPVTGVEYQKTHGIDRGWDYNGGKSWLAPDTVFGEQLMAVAPDLRDSALGWVDSGLYSKQIDSMITKTLYSHFKGQSVSGIIKPLTHLDAAIINALDDIDQTPTTTIVSLSDKAILSMLDGKSALPVDVVQKIPAIFAAPDAVLYDKDDPALIFAHRMDDGRYAKFIVRTRFKGRLKELQSTFKLNMNMLRTGAIVEAYNLTESRYLLLTGVIVESR